MSKQPTKLKIINEGQPWSTRVETESGEVLPVISVKWEMDINNDRCIATIVCDAELMAEELVLVAAQPVGRDLVLTAADKEWVDNRPMADFLDQIEKVFVPDRADGT